jgi:transposase
VNTEFLPETNSKKSIELLDKSELIWRLENTEKTKIDLEKTNHNLKTKIDRLQALIAELKQGNLDLNENMILVQETLYAKSSERSTKEEIATSSNESLQVPGANDDDSKKDKIKRSLKPSERYPNAEIKIVHVLPEKTPECPCCSYEMQDSGMTEDAEKLSIIPKKIIIELQKRHKFRCSNCQGAIATASLPRSITPGGSYSDRLIIDVGLSKFCDLIPMSRYVAIAERLGIKGLPAQSLIAATHDLALFVRAVYRLLKQEVLSGKVLNADETPHRMLEGDEKENWYHWGFSNQIAAYFDIRDTRSGDVASDFLKLSKCEFLMSDVYSGYGKAIRVTNEYRNAHNLAKIRSIYCNAHSRRYFKKAQKAYPMSAAPFIECYRSIYFLESQLTTIRQKDPDLPDKTKLEIRAKMLPFFEKMKALAQNELNKYSSKSSMVKALNYFLENYEEFTLFITQAELPIDNNAAERILRNPVIGRKTWYGTHSRQGAETTAVLFSIIESCKLNKVNPREYFPELVAAIHKGDAPFTVNRQYFTQE